MLNLTFNKLWSVLFVICEIVWNFNKFKEIETLWGCEWVNYGCLGVFFIGWFDDDLRNLVLIAITYMRTLVFCIVLMVSRLFIFLNKPCSLFFRVINCSSYCL